MRFISSMGNPPRLSKRLWTLGLLATLVLLLLLCTLRPERQQQQQQPPQEALQKRGDPCGENTGTASFDGSNDNGDKETHPCALRPVQQTQTALQKRGDPRGEDNDGNDNGDEANHPWWEKQDKIHFAPIWPGPAKEPSNTRTKCDTKAWLFWLSFNAHQHDFERHRKARDILCLPEPAWKSDACTMAPDKPFNSFEFKAACQRRDFAMLNLRQYINRAKALTKEQREREKINFNIWKKIRERYRIDLDNACLQEAKGAKLFCRLVAKVYYYGFVP
ncbi:hypothetical protein IWZ00DRAFT_189872 [Phyllosticta capitalensis]|uniref:uncharacterized protein n=1 Tax=Phyllosticta capitalensis TaxID=121624 RepID=UPI00312E689F